MIIDHIYILDFYRPTMGLGYTSVGLQHSRSAVLQAQVPPHYRPVMPANNMLINSASSGNVPHQTVSLLLLLSCNNNASRLDTWEKNVDPKFYLNRGHNKREGITNEPEQLMYFKETLKVIDCRYVSAYLAGDIQKWCKWSERKIINQKSSNFKFFDKLISWLSN